MKTNDTHTVQFVIAAVAVIGVLALLAAAYLAYCGTGAEAFLSLTASCVTGLLALLAQTRMAGRQRDEQEK